MMPANSNPKDREFIEINKKLDAIQKDLKRFVERSNQQHIELVSNASKRELSGAIIGHIKTEYGDGLDRNMVKKCDMREECRAKFDMFLESTAGMIGMGRVHEQEVNKSRSDLKSLHATAPYKQCDRCFAEAGKHLERQIDLMKSLRIYDLGQDNRQEISSLPVEQMIEAVLEPISNKTRLQILKALYTDSKTFSSISELTGLRGGNLLFHLQKLLESGLIIQRHEGGDYMITEKGYTVLNGINSISSSLNLE